MVTARRWEPCLRNIFFIGLRYALNILSFQFEADPIDHFA
jgi:hypothetical protein